MTVHAAHHRVVVFGRDSISTRVIASALARQFDTTVLIERPPSVSAQFRSRMRLLGIRRATGQAMFRLLSPLLALRQRRRMLQLRHGLLSDSRPVSAYAVVESINSAGARALLKKLRPEIVVLSGTRIVGKKTLGSAPRFVNMHAGITPMYRGVHGGYWAMVAGDDGNVGVTIHEVDHGIDTGAVLKQVRIAPETADGFYTLPLLQLKCGVGHLVEVVGDLMAHEGVAMPHVTQAAGDSRQWFHPTLLQYLRNGLMRGIW